MQRWASIWGRQLDTETGLYYYRARCLHAQLGRFASRDPIGYMAGVNLAEYVWNSPASRMDPSGTQIENETGAPNVGSTPPNGNSGIAVPFVPGIRPVELRSNGCVDVEYTVKFVVPWDKIDSSTHGYVIQLIVTMTGIFDCATGEDITGEYGNSKDNRYWEAFPLFDIWMRRRVEDYDDRFSFKGNLKGTRGFYLIIGVAKGATNWELPPSFEGPVPGSGLLFGSYVEPVGWGMIQGASHSLKVTWDCCCGKHRVTATATPPLSESEQCN